MKGALRFAIESLLLFLLSGAIFALVIVAAKQLFTDERALFVIVVYVVVLHHDLVRWIWKRLRIEKADPA